MQITSNLTEDITIYSPDTVLTMRCACGHIDKKDTLKTFQDSGEMLPTPGPCPFCLLSPACSITDPKDVKGH